MNLRPAVVSMISLLLALALVAAGVADYAVHLSRIATVSMMVAIALVFVVLHLMALFGYGAAQTEYRKELAAYHGAVQHMPAGIALARGDASIIFANDLFNDASARGARAPIRDAIRDAQATNGGRLHREVMCEAGKGGSWWAGITVGPIAEVSDAWLVSIEDVTSSRHARQLATTSQLQLALQAATVDVLSRGERPEQTLPSLLQTLGEQGNWWFAAFWSIDRANSVMVCRHNWVADGTHLSEFVASSESTPSPVGMGLIGDVWEQGQAVWLSEKPIHNFASRLMKGERAGLHSAFAFPIHVDGAVEGVVEFWGKQAYEAEAGFTQAMTAVGSQVASYLSHDFQRQKVERRLRTSEERYRTITEIAQDAIVSVDDNSIMTSVNRAAELLFGYSRAEMMGKSLTILMPENMRASHLAAMQRYRATGARHIRWDGLELPAVRKDGSSMLIRISLAEFKQEGQRTFTGYMHDITEQKQEESALVYQALHDTLTELPNRVLLQERLERAIVSAHRARNPISLMFMDLDRFKEVNDTLGHHAGDELLKQVAVRLHQTLRESDTVARLGGDEFAIMLPSTDEPGSLLTANRIIEVLGKAFEVEGKSIEIGTSIGIAMYPVHGEDVATLMRRADVSMYAAKRGGTGFMVYSAERDEANAMRLVMTGELRKAIDGGQLFLHYQPKVRIRDGEVSEAEALIRWQHPERGFIPPDGFIPLAEETGLVKPLTVWLLQQVVKQHRIWKEAGRTIRISVNFSARTLHDHELVDTVLALIAETGIEPSALQVEITESALMMDPERALTTLAQLHTAGLWTSIDDFGTGYSSLGYLKQLPVDEVKIDKSFVLDMASSRDDQSIVRSVVALGHNLGLQVVAEGVENKRTLDMLAAMECDLAQGYFISRPIPPVEFGQWLEALNTPTLEIR